MILVRQAHLVCLATYEIPCEHTFLRSRAPTTPMNSTPPGPPGPGSQSGGHPAMRVRQHPQTLTLQYQQIHGLPDRGRRCSRMPLIGLVLLQRALEVVIPPSIQSARRFYLEDWATRTRANGGSSSDVKPADPCQPQTGENPGQGMLERVLPGPRVWAAEAVETRQGAEEKSGSAGTGWRKLTGSLHSLST